MDLRLGIFAGIAVLYTILILVLLNVISDTVRKTAKVVDSWFGQATRMVDVKHVDAFQGLFMACISGLEACLRPLCPSVGSRHH